MAARVSVTITAGYIILLICFQQGFVPFYQSDRLNRLLRLSNGFSACFGVAIVLVILAFTGIYAWFEWFKENQADLVALSVFLVSLALIIFFADVFKAFLPVNLLLLLLLVQITAMLARVGYKQYRKSKGYYY